MLQKRGMHTVLDTNIVISALLFRGKAAPLHKAIIEGNMFPYRCPSILEEYSRVLAYDKFGLTDGDIHYLLQNEILPFFHPWKEPSAVRQWISEDPSDDKFINLAISVPNALLISGDNHILEQRDALPCTVYSLLEGIEALEGKNV